MLNGKWFHSKNSDGEIIEQGKIIDEKNGKYLCQFFSWVTGYETTQELRDLSEMDHWVFYENGDSMRDAYANYALNGLGQ